MVNFSPAFGALIMMNNYFHDVATALLAASGIALWVIIRKYYSLQQAGGVTGAVTGYFLSTYASMKKLARFSLVWILVGGIPRTLYYRSFEWSNAVEHAQVPSLIVKHVLAFLFVSSGVYMWYRFSKEAGRIASTLISKED